LRDFLSLNKSWIETALNLEISGPGEELRRFPVAGGVLRRIGASIPQSWVPVARRGLSGVSARLPVGLRERLHRMIGWMGPDMGSIERDYPDWIARYDRIGVEAKRRIVARIAHMNDPPLISVLMPVFDPAPDHLRAAIQSVQDQFYPWWELCIADDASTDPAVTEILRDAALGDHRIKLVRREQNGHISAASNSALDLATGLFVALLDHDDVLAPNALYEVATRIDARPELDIVYSDEDHIDNDGRRSHPYFKPGWSPELLLGQNLISHLGVYRRALVERIGGFRVGLEGSQDHDLALRVVGETTADRIVHIPKVLYHWRQGAADRTFSEAAHDRCVRSSRRAIAEFVARDRPGAKVAPAPVIRNWTRVVHPVPVPEPMVSVIISSIGSTDALLRCIDGLLNRTDYSSLEILIGSANEATVTLPDELAGDPRVRVMDRHSSPRNAAAAAARGSVLLLLDTDLDPGDPSWLREMVSHAIRPGVGAVGAKLLDPHGTVRHAGIAVGGRSITFCPFAGRRGTHAGYFGHLQLTRDVTAVSGKCLMLLRQNFNAAGGFDEATLPSTLNDVDLCLKLIQAGFRNVWTPHAELYHRDDPAHHQDADTGRAKQAAARMRQRWGHQLDSDPYWSPNLVSGPGEMALRFPPRDEQAESLQAA
jgi:glycosyltransferase involved in cell wall biosynthesis